MIKALLKTQQQNYDSALQQYEMSQTGENFKDALNRSKMKYLPDERSEERSCLSNHSKRDPLP